MTGPHYDQIAVAQWRVIHFGTPRLGPIYTPNIGPVGEGLISISPTESPLKGPRSENKATCHVIRLHYDHKAAFQRQVVHFGTPRLGPFLTPKTGLIDEGLVLISPAEYHSYGLVKGVKWRDVSYNNTTTRSMEGWFKFRPLNLTHRVRWENKGIW